MTEQDFTTCPLGAAKCPIFDDIERLNLEVTQLRQQVIRDSLTGLFNKRYFDDALATEMERSRRNRLPTSLILLDIDHFKAINDQYGHVAGDFVLEKLAHVLKQTVRMIDIPCRYGGEEFAVILPSTPLMIACHVAERLREAVNETHVALDTNVVSVTASLGVSYYIDAPHVSPHRLVEQADKQLYMAKNSGRNRVCCERWAPTSTQLSKDEKAALSDHDSTSK